MEAYDDKGGGDAIESGWMIVSQPARLVLLAIMGLLLLIRAIARLTVGMCKSNKCMKGKTIIVTGANTGIGKATALNLASRGARVILACRNLDKAENAAIDIMQQTGNKEVLVKKLDLCSFKSIRAFAEDIISTEASLSILINNAGMPPPKTKSFTEDGLDELFQANYMGHFLLTMLLLDLLKKNSPSRIINVSSVQHHIGSNSRLLSQRWIYGWTYAANAHYGDTKLAQIHFTKQLDDRLKGTGVTVNSLHPGMVRSDIIFRYITPYMLLLRGIFFLFGKTIDEGAQTTIHLAVSDDVQNIGGHYFSDCQEGWLSIAARDERASRELWKLSLKLTGLQDIKKEA